MFIRPWRAMAYALHGFYLKLASFNLLVHRGIIAPLPWSAWKGQKCVRVRVWRPGSWGQASYIRCHSSRCWSLEEWRVLSSRGHSRGPCWFAGSGFSHRGEDGRHPVCTQRHSRSRGSGTGPSASWRECTRTRAPARTAPSSGGYLQCQHTGENKYFHTTLAN